MEVPVMETLGQIAGISGIALGVFLLLFRDVIRKNILSRLTPEQAYRIIRLALILTFLIAIAGIAAWAWSEQLAFEKVLKEHPGSYNKYTELLRHDHDS